MYVFQKYGMYALYHLTSVSILWYIWNKFLNRNFKYLSKLEFVHKVEYLAKMVHYT